MSADGRSARDLLDRLLARGPDDFEQVVAVDDRQRRLTETHILPALPLLEREFLEIREQVDRALRVELSANPAGASKGDPTRYPKGYCLPITRAALQRFIARGTGPNPSEAFEAVWRFHTAGGVVGRIWGVLRERYFQNAIQLGTHYFDVANDTVDVRKPKIEHMPLAESGFRNVASIADFVQIAEGYWGCRLYPNLFFAKLIPLVPLLRFDADGDLLSACVFSESMHRLNRRDGFREAEAFLRSAARDGHHLPDLLHRRLEAYRRRHLPKATPTPPEGLDDAAIRRACDHAREGWNGGPIPDEIARGMLRAAQRIRIGGAGGPADEGRPEA